jgi:hypothetical protein
MHMSHLAYPRRMVRSFWHPSEELPHVYQRRPALGIGGIILIGCLVALGVWAWPEVQRTMRIHRM